MKKKRIIRIKDPKLLEVRKNLRLILDLAVNDKLNILRYISVTRGTTPRGLIDLQRAYNNSIIKCPLCNNGLERDMVYSSKAGEWWCEVCVSKVRANFIKRKEKENKGKWVSSDYDEDYVQGFF